MANIKNRVREIPVEVLEVHPGRFRDRPKYASQKGPFRYSWLDYRCDGCDQYYKHSKDDLRGHTHSKLYKRRVYGDSEAYFGTAAEPKGFSLKKFAARKKIKADHEDRLIKLMNTASLWSNDIKDLGIYRYYQWMLLWSDSNGCYHQLGDWDHRTYEHQNYGNNENDPLWLDTGWSYPGSYFNTYQDEALELTNWDFVIKSTVEEYPGYFVECGGKLLVRLPQWSLDFVTFNEDRWSIAPGYVRQGSVEREDIDWNIEEVMTDSVSFQVLKTVYDLHCQRADYCLLDEDADSEKETDLINDSFDSYAKRSVEEDLLKEYPQLGIFDENALKGLMAACGELGVLPDEEDLQGCLVLPEEIVYDQEASLKEPDEWGSVDGVLSSESLLFRLYERSCTYHGELYWSSESQLGHRGDSLSEFDDLWAEMTNGWSVTVGDDRTMQYERKPSSMPDPPEDGVLGMFDRWLNERERQLVLTQENEMIAAGQAKFDLPVEGGR
jgi:hypothetical protein